MEQQAQIRLGAKLMTNELRAGAARNFERVSHVPMA
jgi:hypothetical protein